jgi:hypothetical protein
VKCNYCSYTKPKNGTTTHLWHHLNFTHKIIAENATMKRPRTFQHLIDDNFDEDDDNQTREMRSLKPAKIAKIDNKIIEWIIDAEEPISSVDRDTFKAMFKEVCPAYIPPCRQTVARKLIPEKVNNIKNKSLLITYIVYNKSDDF